MKFLEVASAFADIERESSRLKMTHLLGELFKKANAEEINLIANLSLGQLQAPYLGQQFNMAEKNLIKVIAELLNDSEHTIAQQLKVCGDLGIVAGAGAWSAEKELSVHDVYAALSDLQKISGTGSQEEKGSHLLGLLKSLDPLSAKYIVRVILGKLRLGFSDMTVIDALSWMEAGNKSLRAIIENAYNLSVDIGYISSELKSKGIKALEDMTIKIGIPIRPAAAERLPTARAIIEKLGPSVAQPKLDGFRLQIHVKKNGKGGKPEIHFFSRNLLDMSYMFPDIAAAVAQLDVQELICEGEAIVYDTHTNTFLPFQETVKRKRKHGIEQAAEEFPLRVFIFDLLYLNGKEYLNATHEERRTALLKLFAHFPNPAIQVIGERQVNTGKELEEYFAENIAAGLEGLVVKRADAIYQPGKRNFNWIKLKRQEEGHLEDTVDCVILGYYAGEGKRATFGIGAFLVGLYNPHQDRFETVAKIGTGLSDEQWVELKKKCDAIAVQQQPKNVLIGNKDLIPHVLVDPSIVCIILADEITISPAHTAGKTEHKLGYALRFPRFMGYSIDKSAEEATAVHEIERMYQDQFKK